MQIIDLSLLFILYSFALANIRIKIEISLTVNKQEQPTKIMRIPNGTFANDYHLKLVPFDKFKFFFLSRKINKKQSFSFLRPNALRVYVTRDILRMSLTFYLPTKSRFCRWMSITFTWHSFLYIVDNLGVCF